jgi:transposase
MGETIEGGATRDSVKRIKRTVDEKRRIVEATLIPGASIARVAREHGVNANQVFQWRYEYRKGTLTASKTTKAKLLPVAIATEPCGGAFVLEAAASPSSHGSIHIELPGRALVTLESGVDAALARAVLESLAR